MCGTAKSDSNVFSLPLAKGIWVERLKLFGCFFPMKTSEPIAPRTFIVDEDFASADDSATAATAKARSNLHIFVNKLERGF